MRDSSSLARVLDEVRHAWELRLDRRSAETLHGGEESVAVRVGDVVIRIGPAWRSSADAEWCYELADRLGARCREVVRPIRAATGHWTTRVDGCPVSVWPWTDGLQGDRAQASHRREAAAVLARLHRAAQSISVPPRPPLSATTRPDAALVDETLDAWVEKFKRDRPCHALHGDYYPGNVLFEGHTIAAVLDWDEAVVDVPEVELAMAACEWADLFSTGQLDGAIEFVETYHANGGTASRLDTTEVKQLYRARLRWELEYELHNTGPLDDLDEEQRRYRERQLALYFDLRP